MFAFEELRIRTDIIKKPLKGQLNLKSENIEAIFYCLSSKIYFTICSASASLTSG